MIVVISSISTKLHLSSLWLQLSGKAFSLGKKIKIENNIMLTRKPGVQKKQLFKIPSPDLRKQCKFGSSWALFICILFLWLSFMSLFVLVEFYEFVCLFGLVLWASCSREVSAPEAAPRCPDVDVAQRRSSAECLLLLSGRISARLPGRHRLDFSFTGFTVYSE